MSLPTERWCMQCGIESRPTLATGVDEEGDPACRMHMGGKPAPEPTQLDEKFIEKRFAEHRAAFAEPEKEIRVAPKRRPVCQPEMRVEMKPETMKQCPGFEKTCAKMIGPKAALCARCYANRQYRLKHPNSGPAEQRVTKKSNGHHRPAKTVIGSRASAVSVAVKKMLDGQPMIIAVLRADLQRKLAALALVEEMLAAGASGLQ